MPLPLFLIDEGPNRNFFLQDDQINVHVVWRRVSPCRLVFAFPEGNTGAGVSLDGDLDVLPGLASWSRPDDLRGVSLTFRVRGSLGVGASMADTIRTLRDGNYPEALEARHELRRRAGVQSPQWAFGPPQQPGLVYEDRGITGLHRVRLELAFPAAVRWMPQAEGGRLMGPEEPWELEVRAGHDLPLFHPLGTSALLSRAAALRYEALPAGALREEVTKALRNLAFQVFEEKVVAGSWQYLTYFGRDTLMTSLLLGPTASVSFHEIVLNGVLARLSADGRVAHEEDIGEQAAYRRLEAGGSPGAGSDTPWFDYKMIDDDFLLIPAVKALAEHPETDPRSLAAFLSQHGPALDRNIRWCLDQLDTMVPLRHEWVGDWRDSQIGLGGGAYPNSVNVGLVPVFWEALDWYTSQASAPALGAEKRAFWKPVPRRFQVHLPADEARRRLGDALSDPWLSPEERRWLETRELDGTAVADWVSGRKSIPSLEQGLRFPALSLDAQGAPVAVMNSDLSFRLFLGRPEADELDQILGLLERPYPLGLAHPAGFLTANPLFSDRPDLRRALGRQGYHGTVVWGWQDAMILLGLRRQGARPDLAPDLVARIRVLEDRGRDQRRLAAAYTASELWTWTVHQGEVRLQAFGAEAGDETESNAIQLWSSAAIPLILG